MDWDVEYTDPFGDWWETLDAGEQESVDVSAVADRLYDEHLREIDSEDSTNG